MESVNDLICLERLGIFMFALLGFHSHIKNLGIDDESLMLNNFSLDCGLIGQYNPRKGVQIFLNLLNSNEITGRILVVAGPKGTGKSALIKGIN